MKQSTCQHNWYPHDDYYTCLNCGLSATDAEVSGDLARQCEQQRRAACYPTLVAALETVEHSTGCGLEVPAYIHDGDAWEVTVGAIRQCRAALALARGKGED